MSALPLVILDTPDDEVMVSSLIVNDWHLLDWLMPMRMSDGDKMVLEIKGRKLILTIEGKS